jgi:hypothetical protein
MSEQKTLKPTKSNEFDIFCIWSSLPAFIKTQPEEVLKGKLGIDDPFLLELASLKTRAQFSERFGVDADTLTNWGKYVDQNPNVDDIKKWAKKLTKNVVMGVYNQAIKKGGENAKLWIKWVEDWKETSTVDVSGQLSHITYEVVTRENLNESTSNTDIPKDDTEQ